MLIENVFPAIRQKMPVKSKWKTLFVQEVNAKPHPGVNDVDVICAGARDRWDIKLKSQPPNSPDHNVLDLGFFNAIQTLQHQASPQSVDKLIQAVISA